MRTHLQGRHLRQLFGRLASGRAARLDFSDKKPSSEKRILFGAFMLGAAFLVLASQLAAVVMNGQGSADRRSAELAMSQWRADIVDRNGQLLATNAQTNSLYAHPQEMTLSDIDLALSELAVIFPDMEVDRLKRQLNHDRKFVWIRSRISPRQVQAVNEIGVPGLHFGKRKARIYPNGRLGSHVLGGTAYGEQHVNWAELKGVGGVEQGLEHILTDREAGEQVVLSLDLRLQGIVEEVLAHGVKLYHAKAGSAVLMDAGSGEILSLASYPDFDPNNRDEYFRNTQSDHGPLFNAAVQGIYELGSTFKVFAAAQALHLGLINPSTMIDGGGLRVAGREIKDYFGHGAPLSVEDVIVKSSNVGAARIGLMIGGQRQAEFFESLGFSKPTGLEVAESVIAKPMLPSKWGRHTTVTVSYGHGVSVSPLHLTAAYASLVNGGCKVNPTILKQDGRRLECNRVISMAASRQITAMLGEVVASGTAARARMDTISVGGKTGTADKVNPKGGYYKDKVLAAFASVFPVENPQYVLVLTMDEPTTNDGSKWQRGAGNTVVPVAAEIISRVSPFLLAKGIADEFQEAGMSAGGV